MDVDRWLETAPDEVREYIHGVKAKLAVVIVEKKKLKGKLAATIAELAELDSLQKATMKDLAQRTGHMNEALAKVERLREANAQRLSADVVEVADLVKERDEAQAKVDQLQYKKEFWEGRAKDLAKDLRERGCQSCIAQFICGNEWAEKAEP